MMDGSLALKITRPLKPITAEHLALPEFHTSLKQITDTSGLQAKSIAIEAEIDGAQLSKILSGQAGIMWEKLESLMDVCGSELPLMWMLHRHGWDVGSLRRRESELERQLREETEKRLAAESKLATITEFFAKSRAA